MKAFVVRLGILGTLVVLGWITIAHAQRDSEGTNPLRPSVSADDNSRAPAPLRSAPPRTEPETQAPASPPPGDSIPDAAAIGLAPRRNLAAPPRYPSRTVAATEEASAGPALSSRDPSPAAGNRYLASEDRNRSAAPPEGRYAPPAPMTRSLTPLPAAPATRNLTPPPASQEPPAFRADPNAVPANPPPTAPLTRGGFSTPAVSSPSDLGQPANVAGEGEGSGQPGDPRLEGVQSPQLTIHKQAPKEIQVGKPATFCVTVRNNGSTPASDVEVYDQVPKGTRLLGTTPQARRGPRGEIVWTLGTIRPNEEAKVEMQLVPTAEGEIGSVATVHFGAGASARAIATRPQLVVQSSVPKQVMIGDQVMLSITISNPGTGVATGVVLEEHIPPGLQHPAGRELEYQVGDLKPGESRKLDLPLVANQQGVVTNLLSARGDGNLRVENKCAVEIVAPRLDVAVGGPKRRYLERQAKYEFSVSNPGTAPARGVELIASLPPGLKFVSANNAGYYEESTRTVRWRLEELPANEVGSVELVTLPVEPGQHALRLRGTAQKGLIAEKEQPVLVEGIAAILFQVADTADPIEIGGETTYEVHVVNQGSKAATNVRLAIDLPPELRPVAAEGPTAHEAAGNRVTFAPLGQLAPKAETTYRLRVKAMHPGDLRARFQLLTDDMQTPVTKEESTRVYADE
jgi:uncharacterized repeat protein (TIGR01451 family)